MCGRMVATRSARELAEIFDLDELAREFDLAPRFNVAPGQAVAAIRQGIEGGRDLVELRWGLVPAWAKQPSIGHRLINARSETAASKPAFRSAFRRRRCIVPADGFYEWRKRASGSGKAGSSESLPYYFREPGGDALAIAGLWESWTHPVEGEILESCTLLTTEANSTIRPIHHRMPVLLRREDWKLWLDPDRASGDELQALLVPSPPDQLESIRVSTWVNNPGHEDPRCIEPA